MRFLSVCSGIEAASVAWSPLGWKASGFSEIEPFPCAVLKHHYPDVPNHGDMTSLPAKIRAGEVEAPDLLCGGTPCQAFSVAGLRQSLSDARGNLTLTFCEIADAIDAMRKRPSIIFWENVPGVLNTKDNAFGCFLGALAGEDDALVAPGGRWANAGFVDGPQRAVAWRVLDAQYFGVAQRRRRVFVIASARSDFDPAAVLFEFEGVRRDTAPSREKGEEVAGTIEASLGRSRGAGTSTAAITMAHGQGGAEIGFDRGPTLTCNHEAPIVTQPIALAENTIGRKPHNGGNGDGFTEGGPMYTLNATGVHGVVQPVTYGIDGEQNAYEELMGTLRSHQSGGFEGARVASTMQVRRLTPVECERLQGFPDGYTNIPWRKAAEAPDGPRYKALGNSWAVPVVRWIGERIERSLG
jgi:DNA (cytosine-5)-methyltransferase 1